MTNRDEIIRALRLLFVAGDVFEIRVLKAVSSSYQRPHTESGYFDYEHIPQAADALGKLRSFAGAYVTLNPVDNDLLARACNRLAAADHSSTTADDDTLCRRWLPIDCDPDRKSGISSSEEEHEAALSLAREIRDGLASMGWPEPIMLDSGNGAQMLYRIDLPTKDDNLVQNAIISIAGASSDRVHVDTAVYNPARIWRIPGTMNCKGDSVPERPHRMAHIISVPDTVQCVPQEKLSTVVSPDSTQSAANSGNSTHVACDNTTLSDFCLEEWMAKYLPGHGPAIPYNGGTKWQLDVCPFNPEHKSPDSVIYQGANGEIAFKCSHNSCANNDWHKLREVLEPGCYDRPQPQEYPDVDLSGLLRKSTQAAKCSEKSQDNTTYSDTTTKNDTKCVEEAEKTSDFPDPGEMPERLLHVPGFINEYVDCSMSSAPRPNRVISFCSALAFLSYVSGRKIISNRNTLPNLYLIALANSGVGKDHPRKITMTAAVETGLGGGLVEEFKSGSGIEDALYLRPSLLYQRDEIDTLFKILKMAKDENTETMLGRLLNIYGSSNGFIKLRNLSLPRSELLKMKKEMASAGDGDDVAPLVVNPYLTIFGTAVPQFFFEAQSNRMLANGMTARCLILDAGQRGPRHRSKFITIPDSLKESINVIKAYHGEGAGNLSSIYPSMRILEATQEADELLDASDERYDALYHKYEASKMLVPMAFWARAQEKVVKLAMLYAISSNVREPVITREAVEWACEFTEFLTNQTLFMVQSYSYENPFDEKCQKFIRILRENGGILPRHVLVKRLRENKDTFDQVVGTLTEAGIIEGKVKNSTGGRDGRIYVLIEK